MRSRNSKKAQSVTMFLVIMGILFVIALIVIGTNFISKLLMTFDNTKDTLAELTTAITDVAYNYDVGSGKRILLRFDENSGIIAFNPGSDFFFYVPQDQKFNQAFGLGNLYGRFMKRPSSCEQDSFCICSCEHLHYIDVGIATVTDMTYNFGCEKTTCRNINDVRIPEKIYMKEVFDYGQDVSYRDFHYWDNSFILGSFGTKEIWRRDVIQPVSTDRAIFAGYHEGTYDYAALFLKKVSVSPPVVTICFKDDCFGEYFKLQENELKCPYTRCNQIFDSVDCDNPENIPGCKSSGLDCTYDYPSSKCVAR